jgi:hypothetical protein
MDEVAGAVAIGGVDPRERDLLLALGGAQS